MGNVSRIHLGGERYATVDTADLNYLSAYSWHAIVKTDKLTYAARPKSKVERARGWNLTTLMHRLLMEPPRGLFVDHINGDGLDNRRENLRVVTFKVNARHRTNLPRNNTTGVIGVWVCRTGEYEAYVHRDGRQFRLGRYATLGQATAVRAAYIAAENDKFLEDL